MQLPPNVGPGNGRPIQGFVMREPKHGERVHIRPAHKAVKIQRGAASYGQFLPDEGEEREFDEFMRARWLEGSIIVSELAQPQSHGAVIPKRTFLAQEVAPEIVPPQEVAHDPES